MEELTVRCWRVMQAEPHGSLVWFDPEREVVKLYRLPPLNSEEASEMYVDDVLDGQGRPAYLDKVVSMSELEGEGEVSVQDRYEQGSLFKEERPLPF